MAKIKSFTKPDAKLASIVSKWWEHLLTVY